MDIFQELKNEEIKFILLFEPLVKRVYSVFCQIIEPSVLIGKHYRFNKNKGVCSLIDGAQAPPPIESRGSYIRTQA